MQTELIGGGIVGGLFSSDPAPACTPIAAPSAGDSRDVRSESPSSGYERNAPTSLELLVLPV